MPFLVIPRSKLRGGFIGERFWARGYAVSTVGFEEEPIRAYIKHQEQLDAQGADESGEF